MTQWAAFAGVACAVTALLLLLSHASARAIGTPPATPGEVRWLDRLDDGADHLDARTAPAPAPASPFGASMAGDDEFSTGLLLVNVTFSQGLFAVLLVAAAWFTGIPASAFGVPGPDGSGAGLATGLALGGGFGLVLAVANALAGAVAERLGRDPGEELRALLAPDSAGEWVLLLVVVLPVIAGFEELLFRGALVGVLSAGFGVSPWLLAVGSSVAFGLGHGAQGPVGVGVTALLGFVLAAGFVLTGSLLVVVVAHYLVNAAEFLLHEGLDVDAPLGV